MRTHWPFYAHLTRWELWQTLTALKDQIDALEAEVRR